MNCFKFIDKESSCLDTVTNNKQISCMVGQWYFLTANYDYSQSGQLKASDRHCLMSPNLELDSFHLELKKIKERVDGER